MFNMPSHGNFQSDNAKYSTKEGRNNYNPEFNSTVEAKGKEEYNQFRSNLDKYIDFVSWARFYPDLFLDLIKPKTGGIKLHSDQRTFMRIAMRFLSMYGVYPRGWGKTFNEEIVMFIACVFYPGIEFSLTAQTKENAAELLKDKYNDILKKYPWFKNEIYDAKFSKNDAEIKFINDSRIDVLANSQSSKGQRRHIIMIEESALLDDFTFQDALFPIVEHGRITVGELGINNPEELSQKVNFYTTAGFRGSDEFARSIRMKEDMINLQGKIVLGSDWHLGCWYGRGSTKQQILDKKKNMSPIAFAQNYESKWVGSIDGALVDINKLLNLRILNKAKIRADKDGEYYIGVDVARSQDTSNNQSSVSVIEVKRNKNGKISDLCLVNLFNISNALNFTAQVVEIKKIKRDFNAKMVICDSNGLGVGLIDELMKESFDPKTKESLGCWNTINTEAQPEINEAERCLYDLKPQSANSDIIVAFIDMVESGKLRLLEKKQDADYSLFDRENYIENVVPFVQTDFLIEEIANLQLKALPSGKVTTERVIKKYNRDRFSALAYVLWYIKTFEDTVYQDNENDLEFLAQFAMF
jgi:ribonucleoside-diphosphate reductase alpha chain